jgi:murein DD-endopeptidase MepM/ murein hydrolase activator NlpD
VLPGQLIGKSGSTGYAEAPHLHISVKVQKISIDPEAFLELFKEAR